MSWKDRLDNSKFSITCGDGKLFTPLWIRGEKAKDFNVKIYDFIDVEGSFAERRKPKSNKYPLVFYFQGDDNIDQSNDFEKSANDPRPWQINHPFYGVISGQPTNLKRDDNNYNVTQITVDFWESVSSDFPNTNVSVRDRVTAKKVNVLTSAGISFSSNGIPKASDITPIKTNANQTLSSFNPLLDETNRVEFENVYSAALKASDNLLIDSSQAIQSNQELFNLPSTFSKPVLLKLSSYEKAYQQIKIVNKNTVGKYYFESQGATAIANAAELTLNPLETDYVTRDEVQTVSEILLKMYNDYLSVIDSNQVSIYDVDNAYIPNSDLQLSLYETITETIGNLFLLAFKAKQERIVYTEKDTNLFLLTHRYLGLASDVNIDKFRAINRIKNDELFRVKKGRKIKYFV